MTGVRLALGVANPQLDIAAVQRRGQQCHLQFAPGRGRAIAHRIDGVAARKASLGRDAFDVPDPRCVVGPANHEHRP